MIYLFQCRLNDANEGMGATLHWSQEVIGTLHVLIERIKRERAVSRVRLLDVPCGDMAWMSRFLKTRDDIDYTGRTVVCFSVM